MASSNIPSPTPSSSSSHHPQSFSVMQPPRAPSASSAVSSGSREKPYGYSNGFPPDMAEEVYDPSLQHQTPQPPNMPHPGYANANPSTFLPQLSSSPPPHPPQYIPPPQHAMAPDPIHNIPLGMMPPPGVPGGPGAPMLQGGWPSGPNWRGPPPTGYKLPNGMGLPNSLDGYPMRMGGTPGPLPPIGSSMLQQAILGNGHRPNSTEGRERRRRDRDDDGEEEVISTIFVVGFPDDMQEREFQNIFTFSPGFEAATLKFPSGSNRIREPTAALLAELQQLAANQQAAAAAAAEHGDPPIPNFPLEDALAALQMNTASTSSSTTPSAAISMTPSAPSGPMLGSGGMPTRRQTIGFARFKTRADAIAAKEHLQGRKIDTLTGATLKAEMAKKNLHTKRATSGEELVGLLLRSGRLAGLMNMTGGAGGADPRGSISNAGGGGPGGPVMSGLHPLHPHSTGLSAGAPPQQSAREAWDSWAPAGAPGDGRDREVSRDRSATVGSISASQSGTNYTDRDEKLPLGVGINNGNNGYYPSSTLPTSVSSSSTANPTGAPGESPPLTLKSPHTRATDSKALLALAEEADELEGWSVSGLSTGIGMDYRANQSNSGRANSMSGSRPGVPYGMGGLASGGYAGTYGSSPTGNGIGGGPGSDHMSDTGRSLGAMSTGGNPADQNPPINTLYVGNLPAISPPTHPPNFLEESLRALFSSMPGFKRMSFRQKINGPMCFVEFEDVGFASLAIKELYGHTLGGLVKGGIRLSYSKNSLGQRGNAHLGSSNPMFGGIAHTVALAGMSSPIGTSPSALPGQPPSNSAKSPYPTSASLDRRGSESTTLSPTAQPFNAVSPRSRYFSVSGAGTPPIGIPKDPSPPIPGSHGYPSSSAGSQGTGGFSPTVSSPIRTPASFSWVSSGNGGYAHMGMSPPVTSGGGGGFEGFHGGSLNGAANAWGQSQGH